MCSLTSRCAAAVLALAGVLVPAGAEPPDPHRVFFVHQTAMTPAPVVVVVLDELPLATLLDREGEIDETLFPGFAELARKTTWYRNATTSETFTKEARPALLTGSYPPRRLGETFRYPRSLFSLLGDRYEVRAADIPANICPPAACDEVVAPPTNERFDSFGQGDKGGLFLSFLRRLEPPDVPRLHLLHIVFPHGPWRYLPDGQRYEDIDPMPGEVDERGRGRSWSADRWLVAQGYQRHLLQTRLADRLVSALLAKLRRTGLWHDALVVVTADHGIGWGPGLPKRLPVRRTAGSLAWVPLFVKAPGQTTGALSDAPAETVDLVPTIADHLDAWLWPGVDGVSLARPQPPHRSRTVVDVRVPRGRRLLMRAVDAKYDLLAGPDGTIDPWTVAPGRSDELVGLRRDDLAIGERGEVTFAAARLEQAASARPRSSAFPAFFEGTLQGAAEGCRPRIAIAVNGTVTAVTRAYESSGLLWFGSMLRPGAFTAGDDRIRLYVVDDVRTRSVTPLPRRRAEAHTW